MEMKVNGSGAGRSKFPPFRKHPRLKRSLRRGSGTPLEAWHLAWCLIICVPICTTVCLISHIVVERVFGG